MANERLRAFRESVESVLREAEPGKPISKAEVVAAVRGQHPDLFDDTEPCYAGCKGRHPKWRHLFDRAIYDLTTRTPPALERMPYRKGWYRLRRK